MLSVGGIYVVLYRWCSTRNYCSRADIQLDDIRVVPPMSKADVLQLVDELARGRADPGACEKYYTDIAYEMAKLGITMNAAVVDLVHGTGLYTIPSDAVGIVGVLYDGVHLMPSMRQAVEWRNPDWRSRVGSPQTYVVEDEQARTFRLFPAPDADTGFLGNVFQFGENYPPYSVALIYTQNREDLPEIYDLYIACTILNREFSRESDHRDLPFAEAAGQLAQLFMKMASYG